jgi:hypothetical protein
MLVGLDAISYAMARTVLPFTLVLCVWVLAVTAGHNMHALEAWTLKRRRR